MENNFDLKKFLIENRKSVKEDQERDHQFYANKEGAEIIMQIAKDAINLMDEQPGTSAHIALQSVLDGYIEEKGLE